VAQIVPSDGIEYGDRVTTNSISITSTPPASSELRILPLRPNKNDILKADYQYTGDLAETGSLIKWYQNSRQIESFNNKQYIRPFMSAGDEIFFTLTPFDGVSLGNSVSSAIVTIESSVPQVTDIKIDGQSTKDDIFERIDSTSLTPTISWEITRQGSSIPVNASVKIGTAYGLADIYSDTIDISNKKYAFTVPPNILFRGINYYVSIAVSSNNVFSNYGTRAFIIEGSRWETNVSNSTGWTIEIALRYPYPQTSNPTFNASNYHAIRMNDGTKFAEVRIYNTKIGIFSSDLTLTDTISTTNISEDFDLLTITGQGSNIKVYYNRKLILNGTGKMDTVSSESNLSIQAFGDLSIFYKGIYYTTKGAYDPTSSTLYTNYGYKNILNLREEEVVGISRIKDIETDDTTQQDIVSYRTFFVSRPIDAIESSTIYEIVAGEVSKVNAVNTTFTPINHINVSSGATNVLFSFSKGFTMFFGYPIVSWDYSSEFSSTFNFTTDLNFELVTNMVYDAAFVDADGLNIMTTYNLGQYNA